jgi:hypothetical protein
MAVGAGFGGGDPLAGAVLQGGFAVQRGRHLEPHPGRACDHAAEEAEVEFARLATADRAHLHLDAGGAQPRTLAATSGLGSCREATTRGHTGGGQRIAAGPGAALVGAGLQRHVGGGAALACPRAARRAAP